MLAIWKPANLELKIPWASIQTPALSTSELTHMSFTCQDLCGLDLLYIFIYTLSMNAL